MTNLTLGHIAGIISLLSVIIGALVSILTFSKKFIAKILKPINDKIDHLETSSTNGRNNIELQLIKMILVNFVNDIDQGIHKSPIQKQNAYELFDRYTSLGGNSYIHDRWEKLIKEGKI